MRSRELLGCRHNPPCSYCVSRTHCPLGNQHQSLEPVNTFFAYWFSGMMSPEWPGAVVSSNSVEPLLYSSERSISPSELTNRLSSSCRLGSKNWVEYKNYVSERNHLHFHPLIPRLFWPWLGQHHIMVSILHPMRQKPILAEFCLPTHFTKLLC